MAYIAGATTGAPHVDNFLATLVTFLTGNGWTLHDDLSTTDKVFKSTGTGKEAIYIRYRKNGNNVEMNLYQYWDAVGHSGFNIAAVDGDPGISADDASAFNFWIWTDGRAIVIVAKVGANYSGAYTGAGTRVHDGSIGVLQSDVVAGASIICTVDESFPSIWTAGKKLMVLDQSTTTISAGEVGNEHAEIVSSAAGQVTLNLAQAHQAGALIGFDPQPVFTHENGDIDISSSWNTTNGLNVWGTFGGNGPTVDVYLPMDAIIADAAPDDRTGRLLNQPMYFHESAAGRQEIRAKTSGIFHAPLSGVGTEDVTELELGIYIALPLGDAGRMIWVPTF